MPPVPKHASARARRNRTSTSATLVRPVKPSIPDLPSLDGQSWHPLTLAWWGDIWRSPMAPEFDASDIHGLFMLAALVDGFWQHPNKELAAEIRLQRQCFGLSPIDRRRLQWEIERVEVAQERSGRRRTTQPASPAGDDPRTVLHAV